MKEGEKKNITVNVRNTTELLTIKSQALYGNVAHLPVLPPYVGLEAFHNDGNDFWKKQGGSESIRGRGKRDVYKYRDRYHKSIY